MWTLKRDLWVSNGNPTISYGMEYNFIQVVPSAELVVVISIHPTLQYIFHSLGSYFTNSSISIVRKWKKKKVQ